jgi:hypothetical protein
MEKSPSEDGGSGADKDPVASGNGKESPKVKDAASAHPTKKRYLFVGVVLWIGMMVLAKSLQSSGLAEAVADLYFEEFLAMTGWTNFSLSSSESQNNLRPGYQLAKEGARAKYPIVIIPGKMFVCVIFVGD